MLVYPKTPDAIEIDPSQLVTTLREWGLLGDADPQRQGAWLVGPAFNHHVMFLGCAPELKAHPTDAGDHLHITFSGVADIPQFLQGSNTVTPRCPQCGANESDYSDASSGRLTCSSCGQSIATELWQWRLTAAYTRFYISVAGIYPHEALPSEIMLQQLEKLTGVSWVYAYRLTEQ
jgi:hypothetical protein